jgi:phosphatidylglycerol---prolipoprotein diacylglyceryl transferase
MHPILFSIGPVTIHTYGLFVALGLFLGLWVATRQAKKRSIAPEMIMDMGFYAIISGLLGARIFFVALNFDYFRAYPLEIIKIWNGGLVFFGGFLFALATIVFSVKKKGLSLGDIGDITAVSLPLGHAIGRIGCFSAGCCYGKYCALPWAVTFTNAETLANPIGIPLHPTQLYSVAANFTIFLIMFFLSYRNVAARRLFPLYLILYGTARSIIELFRGDPRGTVLFDWLSTSQAIGITAVIAAIIWLVVLHRIEHRQQQ